MGLVEQHSALNRPEHPVCSVCIANYNGAALLDDCLTSVLAQHGDISIEIIVHDDASTDDSIALLRERYPQVELLASSENVGFCVGNNRMVAHARGEFVLLLNNDAALYPDALVMLLDAARLSAPLGIFSLPQFDWETGALVDRGCLLDPFYNPVPNLAAARFDVAYVIGACLFLPRALWSKLGGFPTWIDSIGEDLYLCCLARLYGYSVQALAASGYRHRQGQSFGGNRVVGGKLSTTYRRRYLSERNKTAVLVICTPTVLMWLLLMLHLLLLTCEGATISAIKRDRQVWRKIYAPTWHFVLSECGVLRARRNDVQRSRSISWREWLRVFTPLPRKLALLRRYGVPRIG
jgi:GT2 family glycosyltransferase